MKLKNTKLKKRDFSKKNTALVTSLFNESLTRKLEQGALKCLAEHNLEPSFQVYVPGAMEIPLAVQALFEKKDCDGVVVLGVVIRGETNHYKWVSKSVERGCSRLQLKYHKPLGFGVLTVENREQAMARSLGAKGNKGYLAAKSLLKMLEVLDNLKK